MKRGRPYKCPYCNIAGENVAKGYRYNKSGKVRLRRCKACGRRWTTGAVSEDDTGAQVSTTDQLPPKPARDAMMPDQQIRNQPGRQRNLECPIRMVVLHDSTGYRYSSS